MRYSTTMKSLLTILLLSVTSCPSWAQEDDPELRKRFLQGVAQTARKLEDLSFRAKCTITAKITAASAELKALYAEKGTGLGKPDTMKFNVAVRGPLGLASRVHKTGNVSLGVRNDAYAFALERSPDGERTTLQFVEQLGIDPTIDAQIAEMEMTPRAMALGSYYLRNIPLFWLIESGSFSIQRVVAVTSGANELVRVEFDCLVDDPPLGIVKCRITDAFLVCDPAQDWALTEYGGTTYVSGSTQLERVALELGESIGGISIATKVSQTLSFLEDPGTTRETVTTIEVTSHDVPEEEFYLSFYGLPEPNFGQSWFGTWGWYLIGGIGCIAVGVVIKWRMNG